MSASDLKRREAFRLDAGMRLGALTLRVRDLESALSFYQDDLGFTVKDRSTEDGLQAVQLGFKQNSEPILRLKRDPAAKVPSSRSAGLYHYAVLVPCRADLASTFLSLGKSRVSYEGFADHTFSEALYLHDAEMNGIEIYADRPRAAWPSWSKLLKDGLGGFAAMNGPLDFDSLLRELDPSERAAPRAFPNGARIGHIHLRVTDLERSVSFYHKRLGLNVSAYIPAMGAAFLSVGGYHHHLGLNIWHSSGGVAHRDGDAGLEELSVIVPSGCALDALGSRFPGSAIRHGKLRLSDPDGIRIEISS